MLKVALIGCGGRGNGAISDCLRATPVESWPWPTPSRPPPRAAGRLGKGCQAKGQADIPPDRVFFGLDAYQKAIDCGVDMAIFDHSPRLPPRAVCLRH